MLKNDCYTIPIDKNTFLKIIDSVSIQNLEVKATTIISYDKENMEFSNADYQYEYLELKEVRNAKETECYIEYTHCYPENETYYNMETKHRVKLDNFSEMQVILNSIGFKEVSRRIIKEATIKILDKYYMDLKESDSSEYSIEFQTVDNHYITKEEYEELNDYLKKYNINHVEDVF